MSAHPELVRDAKYRAITLANFDDIPQVQKLPPDLRKAVRVVGHVLPFKSNNYVVNRLIDWENAARDPMFVLTFPQREMLPAKDYRAMETLLDDGASPDRIRAEAERIRLTLNPQPAGQLKHNRPIHHGKPLPGMQHKYRETILFFPTQGQTCHAYCTFCFRWAQFVGMKDLRFATKDAQALADYLREHPYVTDVLFTGGDPMVMSTKLLASYIEGILDIDTVRTIRIGTRALGYWPQRFLTDPDADELIDLFRRVAASDKLLAIMAHFNHWKSMTTPEVHEAIQTVRETGAQIRTQSPIMRHINDDPDVWAKMWRLQVEARVIPYYMFVVRDTGARRYFEVPLARAWRIYRQAYRQVSGLGRTVRGPSMSATPGKVRVVGVTQVRGEKVFVLNFLQARKPEWVGVPFFAKYDPRAMWLDDLKPAFGRKSFFFEQGLKRVLSHRKGWPAEPAGTAD